MESDINQQRIRYAISTITTLVILAVIGILTLYAVIPKTTVGNILLMLYLPSLPIMMYHKVPQNEYKEIIEGYIKKKRERKLYKDQNVKDTISTLLVLDTVIWFFGTLFLVLIIAGIITNYSLIGGIVFGIVGLILKIRTVYKRVDNIENNYENEIDFEIKIMKGKY